MPLSVRWRCIVRHVRAAAAGGAGRRAPKEAAAASSRYGYSQYCRRRGSRANRSTRRSKPKASLSTTSARRCRPSTRAALWLRPAVAAPASARGSHGYQCASTPARFLDRCARSAPPALNAIVLGTSVARSCHAGRPAIVRGLAWHTVTTARPPMTAKGRSQAAELGHRGPVPHAPLCRAPLRLSLIPAAALPLPPAPLPLRLPVAL